MTFGFACIESDRDGGRGELAVLVDDRVVVLGEVVVDPPGGERPRTFVDLLDRWDD
jgi:hypothetical protein